MTETARTIQPTSVVRLPFAGAAVAALALVAAIGVGQSIADRGAAFRAAPVRAEIVGADAGHVGNLNSEYLINASRVWAPEADRASMMHSEYLITIERYGFRLPTAEQERIRGELYSEYLREAAMGW
jgi:hypothetical protein